MTTKVPLSSLVGQTPVRVRFADGNERLITDIAINADGLCLLTHALGVRCNHRTTLVEVLPLEPVIDPVAAPLAPDEAKRPVRSPALPGHTPGPWRADIYGAHPEDAIAGQIDGPKGQHIADLPNYGQDSGVSKKQLIANAKLIASAPDALALVQRVANLNPDCTEIGAGMLAQIVTEARRIVGQLS